MKKITLNAYAKINLSLDVLGTLENGYHKVDMIMQQIELHDTVNVAWSKALSSAVKTNNDGCRAVGSLYDENKNPITISLSSSDPGLPADSSNLAYKAAEKMIETYGHIINGIEETDKTGISARKRADRAAAGHININIEKHIPIAAGLAGGSSNAAAVILALAKLWELDVTLPELLELGAVLGSDIPFSMAGQAKSNKVLGEKLSNDPLACVCMRAEGTGTDLTPLSSGLRSPLVLIHPEVTVPTPEIYKESDKIILCERPDIPALIKALETAMPPDVHDENKMPYSPYELHNIEKNMINVLAKVTFKLYPVVVYTKNNFNTEAGGKNIYMSGSGPTLFTLADTAEKADALAARMTALGYDSYSTCTSS